MDNAVLFNNVDGGIAGKCSTWTRRWFDGGANYYLRRWNLVCVSLSFRCVLTAQSSRARTMQLYLHLLFQSSINKRYADRYVRDSSNSGLVSCISFGQHHGMAKRCFVLFGCSSSNDGCSLLRKWSISKLDPWVISLISIHKIHRFRKRRCGCCRKIAPKKRKNRCNGCVAGYRRRPLRRNSLKSRDTVNFQKPAPIASNPMRNVRTRHQPLSRSWKS